MTATYDYTCEPENNGTRLTLRAHCNARGIGWKLVSPVIGLLMKRADSGQIAELKCYIESPDMH
jgi:hypothetical protein